MIVNEINPEIIYLNSFFSKFTIKILQLARKNELLKNKIIIAPRGELHPNALSYKKFKKKLFNFLSSLYGLYGNLNWDASTEREKSEILRSGVKIKSIFVLNNFVKFDETQRDKDYAKYVSKLRLIFISRIHQTKNLKFALELLNQLKGEVVFDIFGLLEDEFYWKECKKIIELLPTNIRAQYKGSIPKADVTKTMLNYDLLLFPTLNENFGQVIFEALSVGRPVAISHKTPWKDLEKNKAGYAIPLSESVKFISVLNSFLEMNNEQIMEWNEGAKTYAHKMIDVKTLKQQYIEMFDSVTNKNYNKEILDKT